MSTQIYTRDKLTEEQIQVLTKEQTQKEVRWYMSEFISNQLDTIRDVLKYCLRNFDEADDTTYKLPLSSHKSEVVKGTLTRRNFKIVDLHMVINTPHFNGGKKFEFKMKPSHYMVVCQLLDCHDAMENAISSLDKIVENMRNGNDPDLFVRYVEQACSHIKLARESLSTPNAAYIFPYHRLPGGSFEPAFPKTGALDVLVNDGELIIDFKSLAPVEQKPWNAIIDATNRLSFADVVRKEISKKREIPMNQIIVDEYSKYLQWRKSHPEEPHENTGLGDSFKNMFAFSSNPSISTLIRSANSYLEQSMTFVDDDNRPFVVQIQDKCEVVTSDPVLLSVSVKLESIEKTMFRVRDNLSNIYV